MRRKCGHVPSAESSNDGRANTVGTLIEGGQIEGETRCKAVGNGPFAENEHVGGFAVLSRKKWPGQPQNLYLTPV